MRSHHRHRAFFLQAWVILGSGLGYSNASSVAGDSFCIPEFSCDVRLPWQQHGANTWTHKAYFQGSGCRRSSGTNAVERVGS